MVFETVVEAHGERGALRGAGPDRLHRAGIRNELVLFGEKVAESNKIILFIVEAVVDTEQMDARCAQGLFDRGARRSACGSGEQGMFELGFERLARKLGRCRDRTCRVTHGSTPSACDSTDRPMIARRTVWRGLEIVRPSRAGVARSARSSAWREREI